MDKKAGGKLMIIGGAEDKRGECVILKRLVELAGRQEANMVIMTVASEYPEKIGNEYTHIFKRLGVDNINTIHIRSRQDANCAELVGQIEKASCIFFTGGDQLRITSLLGGTRAGDMLKKAYLRGVVIAGTSAGASVMSETMITSGKDDDAPKKCTLKMAPGLGLLKDVVIDQHFAQRGRIGRLLTAIAQNPHMLGLGIDEDTAVIVDNDAVFNIIGSHAVTILDGKELDYTNVSELKPDEILSITNVIMHVLPSGYAYDIKLRKPLIGR
ncbi:MAG: cyanophycinase [Clostridiales bacterium]|nr:cyanophycinase [Clostridiales bacterium]